MVKADKISRSFGNTEAVHQLTFEVKPGQILGLLGPNGAGKSTTLKIMAGLLRCDQGKVTFNNEDIHADLRRFKRQLAFLPDQPAFFDELTCWEHIEFIAHAYSVKDYETKARSFFERLELSEKRDSFVRELSKGNQQRLAIAMALLPEPTLVLFDEPMTALDPNAIRTVNELLVEAAARGAAVVLSSHLLPLLEVICTDVAIMTKGRCVLQGAVEAIRGSAEDLSKDASLEEIFFYATRRDPQAA